MNHPTREALSAHLDGATTGAARERVEAHLAGCATCRAALADLAARDTELRSALEHDPGDDYFETFAARVEDRIRARGLKGAQSRLGAGRWLEWLQSPRRIAWVGAAAAVIGGAAIVILSSRDIQRPMVNPSLEGREEQKETVEPRRLQERERVGPPRPRQDLGSRAPSAVAPPREAGEADQGEFRELSSPETQEKKAAPEGAALLKDRKTEAAAPPAARDERALERQTFAQEEARAGAAAPSRLQPTRRTAGEDVPAQSSFAAPPKPAVGGTSLKAAKPQAAPMKYAPSADAIASAPLAAGQTRLCGRVLDPDGRPVAGATVVLADRGLTVASDAQGGFCMDAPEGLHELSAMAIGYESARLQIHIEGETSQASVILHPVSVLGKRGVESRANLANEKLLFQGAPTDSVRAAVLSNRATVVASAAAYDSAAAAWTRYAERATESGRAESRYQVAAARFEAWRLDPTKPRATAARQAVDAFLAKAPAGARRDQAQEWKRSLPK